MHNTHTDGGLGGGAIGRQPNSRQIDEITIRLTKEQIDAFEARRKLTGARTIAEAVLNAALTCLTHHPLEMQEAAERLTRRQREVLRLVAMGASGKEIARLLHISTKTVEFHRQRLMEVLDIRNVAGLSRFAVCSGVVKPHEKLDFCHEESENSSFE